MSYPDDLKTKAKTLYNNLSDKHKKLHRGLDNTIRDTPIVKKISKFCNIEEDKVIFITKVTAAVGTIATANVVSKILAKSTTVLTPYIAGTSISSIMVDVRDKYVESNSSNIIDNPEDNSQKLSGEDSGSNNDQ